jgi:hypothetical protein
VEEGEDAIREALSARVVFVFVQNVERKFSTNKVLNVRH